jgi:hypothetical protein
MKNTCQNSRGTVPSKEMESKVRTHPQYYTVSFGRKEKDEGPHKEDMRNILKRNSMGET